MIFSKDLIYHSLVCYYDLPIVVIKYGNLKK